MRRGQLIGRDEELSRLLALLADVADPALGNPFSAAAHVLEWLARPTAVDR